jgi:hypothetical protein
MARDACVALPGQRTITSLANEGLEREVIRLQNEFNGGKRFPKRSAPIRKGRPIVR